MWTRIYGIPERDDATADAKTPMISDASGYFDELP
jgi:hypothetical protein